MSEATEKAAGQAQGATVEGDDFTALLRKEFKPKPIAPAKRSRAPS